MCKGQPEYFSISVRGLFEARYAAMPYAVTMAGIGAMVLVLVRACELHVFNENFTWRCVKMDLLLLKRSKSWKVTRCIRCGAHALPVSFLNATKHHR